MKRNSWKRVVAGTLAVFVVGCMAANIESEDTLTGSTIVVQAADSQEVGTVTQEDVRGVSSFDELVAALADESVSAINLTADITLTEVVNITRDVVIDGNGHVMTGSGTHRGFEIESGVTATIKNATITGIDAGHNHSGVFHNLGTLTVENCILKNNKSTYSAVILESAIDSIQTFRNCQILNNEAEGQGSVFQNYLGPSELTIEGCIIAGNKNNNDGSNGGAICFRDGGGDITLNGCIISDNDNSDLSAFSSYGLGNDVQIKNCVFGTVYDDCTIITDNAVQNGSEKVDGLSILNEDGTLKEIDTTGEVITTANSFVWSDDYTSCTMRIMKVYSTGIVTEDYECAVSSTVYEATTEKCGRTTYTVEAVVGETNYTDKKEIVTQHYNLHHYGKGELVTVPITENHLRCGKIVECYYCSICDKYFSDAEGMREIKRENLFKSDESSEMYNPYGSVMYDFYSDSESKTGNLNFYSFSDSGTYEIPSEINGYVVTSVRAGLEPMYEMGSKPTSLVVPESITYLDWYGYSSLESITIYNRNAEIYGLGYGSENLTVYGYTGSTAETYVNEYNSDVNNTNQIKFVALDTNKAVIKEVSATLDGDIGMNYYLTLPQNILSESGVYVKLAVNGRFTEMNLEDMTPEDDGSYKFTCWLNAKEMHDNVTFSLHDKNDSLISFYTNGGKEINSFDYSLASYFNKLSTISSANQNLVHLAKETLAYGSYAQKAFGYNVDTASSTSDLSDIAAETLINHKMRKEGDMPEGLTLSEMTLILETKTTLRLYFKADDISKYRFTFDSAEVEPTGIPDEGLYYIEVPDISAKDLDTIHTLKIDDCTLTFNALSYAYSILKENKNADLCDAVKALYKYNAAANAYFSG